jgi:hypothetical protein
VHGCLFKELVISLVIVKLNKEKAQCAVPLKLFVCFSFTPCVCIH